MVYAVVISRMFNMKMYGFDNYPKLQYSIMRIPILIIVSLTLPMIEDRPAERKEMFSKSKIPV